MLLNTNIPSLVHVCTQAARINNVVSHAHYISYIYIYVDITEWNFMNEFTMCVIRLLEFSEF